MGCFILASKNRAKFSGIHAAKISTHCSILKSLDNLDLSTRLANTNSEQVKKTTHTPEAQLGQDCFPRGAGESGAVGGV